MPYLFSCPHCQTRTLVDDRYSGQSGSCVTCGGSIQVPEFVPRQQSSAASPPDQAPRGRLSARARRTIAAGILLVLVGCGVVALIQFAIPTVATLQIGRSRNLAIRNIEKIAAALNAYAADHGSYPPPRINGPNGEAMHSWRVLLLPYLGEESLFNRYNMDEPWDSQHNMEVAYRVPQVYTGESRARHGIEPTYFLVTGSGTLFPPAPPSGPPTLPFEPLGPADVRDDPALTLLLVEALVPTGTMFCWTEPFDLDITSMVGTVGGQPGVEIGGVTPGGAAVATVDGRGHFLDQQTPSATVISLLTIDGGEPLPDDLLD